MMLATKTTMCFMTISSALTSTGCRLPVAGSRLDLEHHAHSRFDVLRDVAMQHPLARIRQLEEHVGRETGRDEDGIFPHQVLVGDAVYRRHQETLAVNVDGVLHRME